jgi:hypothetical protein
VAKGLELAFKLVASGMKLGSFWALQSIKQWPCQFSFWALILGIPAFCRLQLTGQCGIGLPDGNLPGLCCGAILDGGAAAFGGGQLGWRLSASDGRVVGRRRWWCDALQPGDEADHPQGAPSAMSVRVE